MRYRKQHMYTSVFTICNKWEAKSIEKNCFQLTNTYEQRTGKHCSYYTLAESAIDLIQVCSEICTNQRKTERKNECE